MLPTLRELLEDADQLVETVIEEEQRKLRKGLDPAERRQSVNAVYDLQQAQALLQKVIFS